MERIYSQDPEHTFVAKMGLDTNTRIAAGLDDERPSLLQEGKAKRCECDKCGRAACGTWHVNSRLFDSSGVAEGIVCFCPAQHR